MMIAELEKISTTETSRTLLLGNGIARAFGSFSWDGMISDMAGDNKPRLENLDNMPFPLKAVVATNDNIKDGINDDIVNKLIDFEIEAEECQRLKEMIQGNFKAILTTNYTYEIEKLFDKSYYVKRGRASKYRKKSHTSNNEKNKGLYQYMKVADENIWHIHGEAAKPDTMILGHYFYGKLLSKVIRYSSKAIADYKRCEKSGIEYSPRTWIDYILFTDLIIVGQGLDYSEMILWWLLNCKKMNGKGKVIWYEPKVADDKRLMAETMNIQVVSESIQPDKDGKDNFKKYYLDVLEKITKEERRK